MNLLKKRERLAEKAHNMHRIDRPELAGAYILNGKQCVCTNYFGAVYDNIYDGLIYAENGNNVDLENLINNIKNHRVSLEFSPNITEINHDLKEKISSRNYGFEKTYVVKFGETYVNEKYFLLIAETLENPIVTVYDKPTLPIIIKGDNGIGIICPINPNVYADKK